MGSFGFSYIGLIYLLMLFIPNIIWTKNMPIGYNEIMTEENKILLIFERVGQFAVSCLAVIFTNFNINNLSIWSLWLLSSFSIMILYEVCWGRYFRSSRTLKDFYGSFLGIPVPLASLPIMGFLLLGIYGKVVWMIIAISILGIGHIGIHLQHLNNIKVNNR
ncbi:hypothetical protein R0131_15780 [Clostridium sp. AL.422]|uniref:hypothetical protein n=1 Tax=Clostridium TaxID=1485 RepID=UPI00293DDCC9|nr:MULTISPECIES: hypothetical protein [unclassified Clostridium]MDV4152286.1 hypothetical protein [Clostridium sp. AL.422]